MFLKKLSIRHRLFFISIAPLVVTALILLMVAIQQINNLMTTEVQSAEEMLVEAKKQELKNIVDMAYRTVKPLYEKGGSRFEAVQIMKNMEFGPDGYLFGYDSDSIRIFSGSSSTNIGESYRDFKDANGVYLINDLVKASKNNRLGSGDEFITYHFPRLGETVPAEKLSYAIYLEKWDLMIGTGIYIDRIDEEIKVFERYILEARNNLVTSISITSGVLIIIMVFISITVVNSILTPLCTVSNSIAKLSRGNGDLTQRVPVQDKFETGELANNLNGLLESLQQTMKRVYQVASDVKTETDALAERADRIKDVSVQQHTEIDLVASATTEMSASSHEVSNNAENAANATRGADDNGKHALEKVQRSSDEMEQLVKEMSKASDVVKEVGDDVENIGAILQVIESIAEQTNLLALNAAIEAARAGEQGRGFAVVADEVRNLASKTQGSTEEIQQMISKLQTGSRSAVQVMEQSIKRSSAAEESVTETSSALNEIASSLGVITDMTSQIATASEEQSLVGSDISKRIVEISEQTAGLNDIALQNNHAAEVLRSKTKELEDIVGQFKL
ncbi:methyl-accepting chemotaxis protein [Marinibactrum halimedae]|uniref:Methyl-accepting chemotaxis protein n=1 Tax=Marinibactrum halimedae TaxID=1444977 RepID=A0AA37TEM4_9GAMM|nr:methyl-accepting chemotaxis protein [Marinibactrum halimedae]MCD9458016.1 methyl-accepting chemotaxis protein [Marinibactrum halimedae]GLS27642.1 methyl-accepting chemotaxis protein [Marinibactrum halimedae]